MSISIITPSFRQSNWLKLCIASVADQSMSAEHIVQDACSDDGTLDWLPQDPRVKVFVEKDAGMYDAVNRGLRRASGEILAYLNCDEQYLEGTLQAVAQFFNAHPDMDVLFGDVIVVDAGGNYLYHRKMQTPLLYHTWVCHLSTLSCAMFFRRRVISEMNQFFDPKWRVTGDAEWMVRLLKQKVKMDVIGNFTSVFTQTGKNMSAGANAKDENRKLYSTAPGWARTSSRLLVWHHRIRRFLGGMYHQKPFSFEIYTSASPSLRVTQTVPFPHFKSPV